MEGWINDSSLSKIELALRHAMRAGISGPFPFKPTAMTLPEMNNRKGLLNINSRKGPFPFLSALFYLSQGKQTISHPEHWLISKVFCHIEVIHRETKNLQIWEWLWQPSGHREIMKQLPLLALFVVGVLQISSKHAFPEIIVHRMFEFYSKLIDCR